MSGDAEHASRLGGLQGEPCGFVRTFAAIAVLHVAFAIGGTRELDDLAHGYGLAGVGAKIIGARQRRPLPQMLRQVR